MNNNQMSVGQWLLTLILLAIPLVNIILLFVWAFGGDNPKKNFSRATLLLWVILMGLGMILGVMGALLGVLVN